MSGYAAPAARRRPRRTAPSHPGQATPWSRGSPTRAVYRRRRLAAVVAAMAALLALGVGRAAIAGGSPAGGSPAGGSPANSRPRQVHVVQPGDTLWSVARRLHPHGDVRATVDRLSESHGPGVLRVGERLGL